MRHPPDTDWSPCNSTSGSDTQDTPCDRRKSTGNRIPLLPLLLVSAAAKKMSRTHQFETICVPARIYHGTSSHFRMTRPCENSSTGFVPPCRNGHMSRKRPPVPPSAWSAASPVASESKRIESGLAPYSALHRCQPPVGDETCSHPFGSLRIAWPPTHARPDFAAASLPSAGRRITSSDGPGRPARRASP